MPSKDSSGKKQDSPSVRLAVTDDGMPSKRSRYPKALGPELRLAHVPGAQGDNSLLGQRGVPQLPKESWPALLVSYWYIKGFLERQSEYAYRDWMLDSGAFSAYNSGKPIDLQEYIDFCLDIKAKDETLVEIIALDVIGSGEGSLKNAWEMKRQGVDAMPVFHIGEDWEILKEYGKNWDKVGLSCRFGEPVKESMRFYEQCFARIWPKKCHSFGWVGEKMLMTFPFHSSDSADWEIKPCQFGTWRAFGAKGSTAYMNVRGSKQNLRVEVEWYLDLERRLREKWRKQMEQLDALPSVSPTVRLVVGTGRSIKDTGVDAINGNNKPGCAEGDGS